MIACPALAWAAPVLFGKKSEFLIGTRSRLISFKRSDSFDLDLPLEVDDEYWIHEDPKQAFRQPPGKPSLVTYMICFIKMTQMMAYALRTVVRIYSLSRCGPILSRF
jgi:hypothetical protein